MEYMLDTANLDEIAKWVDICPIGGVTSNPSILKREGQVPFFAHMRRIRQLIGQERSLHIQVTAGDCAGMLQEAEAILEKVDSKVFIKVPVTEEGLKAIQRLKAKGVGVTATAVYSKAQGYLAGAAGADYLAPYCNRMANLDIDPWETVKSLRLVFDQNHISTKILGASFKNMAQVNAALLAGAHAVTVDPSLLRDALRLAPLEKAVADFQADWKAVRGQVGLDQLED